MTSATAPSILITGAGGFVGGHLRPALRHRFPNAEIHAFGAGDQDLDVTDAEAVARAVGLFAPTHLIHLAAISAVPEAAKNRGETWRVNLGGTLNVLEAIRSQSPNTRLLFISTSEVYGLSLETGEPATEQTLLQPANVYAATKAAADLAVRQASLEGVSAVVARPFNHIGVGQSDAFVVPAFAGQIAAIEKGARPPVIKVGSLDEERDFLTVEDVVDAYVRIIEDFDKLDSGDVFNIASGKPIRIGDILDRLLQNTSVQVDIEVDPSRLRRSRLPRVQGDASRIAERLGWRPTRDLDFALRAVLNDRRQAEAAAAPQ